MKSRTWMTRLNVKKYKNNSDSNLKSDDGCCQKYIKQ